MRKYIQQNRSFELNHLEINQDDSTIGMQLRFLIYTATVSM